MPKRRSARLSKPVEKRIRQIAKSTTLGLAETKHFFTTPYRGIVPRPAQNRSVISVASFTLNRNRLFEGQHISPIGYGRIEPFKKIPNHPHEMHNEKASSHMNGFDAFPLHATRIFPDPSKSEFEEVMKMYGDPAQFDVRWAGGQWQNLCGKNCIEGHELIPSRTKICWTFERPKIRKSNDATEEKLRQEGFLDANELALGKDAMQTVGGLIAGSPAMAMQGGINFGADLFSTVSGGTQGEGQDGDGHMDIESETQVTPVNIAGYGGSVSQDSITGTRYKNANFAGTNVSMNADGVVQPQFYEQPTSTLARPIKLMTAGEAFGTPAVPAVTDANGNITTAAIPAVDVEPPYWRGVPEGETTVPRGDAVWELIPGITYRTSSASASQPGFEEETAKWYYLKVDHGDPPLDENDLPDNGGNAYEHDTWQAPISRSQTERPAAFENTTNADGSVTSVDQNMRGWRALLWQWNDAMQHHYGQMVPYSDADTMDYMYRFIRVKFRPSKLDGAVPEPMKDLFVDNYGMPHGCGHVTFGMQEVENYKINTSKYTVLDDRKFSLGCPLVTNNLSWYGGGNTPSKSHVHRFTTYHDLGKKLNYNVKMLQSNATSMDMSEQVIAGAPLHARNEQNEVVFIHAWIPGASCGVGLENSICPDKWTVSALPISSFKDL